MSTMRAVEIRGGSGDADSLYISTNVDKPRAGDGEALVKIKAFGLNRMDLLQREGRYPVPPQASKILGVEFSGTIEDLGGGVKEHFKTGDEVFGLAYGGAYAEFIVVSTHMLIHKPQHLTWEQCAGIPEVGESFSSSNAANEARSKVWLTATQALHLVGKYESGDAILWHAGASSVSIAGIQLSKAAGASAIFCTAGSDEKIDFCKGLGATEGFNYHTQDWSKEILKKTDGKGVNLIVDFIGAPYFEGNLNCAARDSRIVSLAFMGGSKLQAGIDISTFLLKRVTYAGSSLRSRSPEYQGRLRDRLEALLPRFEDGTFTVPIEKVVSWNQVADAHKLMESNKIKGKIICVID